MSQAVAPRLTPVPGGWKTVGTALGVVLGQPALWVLGSLGFLARGGILVFALPIWSLPTPVGLTTLVGPGAFDGGGLAPAFLARVAPVALVALLLVLGLALVAGSFVDLVSYERFVSDPEVVESRSLRPVRASRRLRLRIGAELVLLQAALLLPLGIGVAASVARIGAVARVESILPSAPEVPLFLRLLAGAAEPLLLLLVTLLLCELLYSTTSRRVLATRLGLAPADEPTQETSAGGEPGQGGATGTGGGEVDPRSTHRSWLGRVGRILVTAATGWVVVLGVLVVALWAVLVAWGGVRTAFLGPAEVLREPAHAFEEGVIALLFGILWTAGLLLIGFASAFRAALWTADSLR